MLRRVAVAAGGLVVLAALVLAAWYRIDGQPLPETASYLSGDGFSLRREPDGSLVFAPAVANGHGLLIMHGALIKPESYARTAAYFAARGYTVYLPKGFARLSILAVDRAAARLGELGVEDWFFIGHSMGGLSALTLVERHAVRPRAIALWATAMPVDFSMLDVPILFLWGDADGLLPAPQLEAAKARLPATARYLTVAGGNHRDFAMYSHQFFDNEGRLGWRQQIDLANARTAEFFAATR